MSPLGKTTNRTVYKLLNFLGDCGGLYDAVFSFFGILAAGVSGGSLNFSLVNSIFKIRRKKHRR